MSLIHTEYVFMTIKSKDLRVAVGNRKGSNSIVYTYSLESDSEEAYFTYRVYLNGLTEDEGQYLQQLVEDKQTRKANSYVLSKLMQEQCIGPCGPVQMSDLVPDEWFDGCKYVMDMLYYPQIKGVIPIDFEEDDYEEDDE